MLTWLTKWFRGPDRSKDTEAERLKAKLHNRVDDLKAKAAQGDSDATLKLGALKQGLTEQSLRLPNKTKLLGFVVLMALALVVGGCGGGLGAKTAKDIETAMEDPILPEYIRYVEADAKLKESEKQVRRDKVASLRFVIKAAQK